MRGGWAKTKGSGKDTINEGTNGVMAFMVKNIYTTVLYKNRSELADSVAGGTQQQGIKQKKREF